MFQNQKTNKKGVVFVGYESAVFAIIWWMEDGKRAFPTYCYDAYEVAYNLNNRNYNTEGRAFEIEYIGKGSPTVAA